MNINVECVNGLIQLRICPESDCDRAILNLITSKEYNKKKTMVGSSYDCDTSSVSQILIYWQEE